MLPLPSSYTVGVDWVTLTYAPGTMVYNMCLWQGRDWVQKWCEPFTAGFPVKPWRSMGYAGWQCGPARVGRRDDSAIIVISSSVVGKPLYLPDLDDARCTRLDIRVDCFYVGERPSLARMGEKLTRAARVGKPGRPWLIDPRYPDPGSDTLYIGKRGSPLFVRLYDKQAESGNAAEYQGCWRLEVELQQEAANDTFHSLRSVEFAEDSCTAACLAYSAERGIRFLGWEYCRWDATRAGPEVATDVARKINWLSTGVRPAIRFLLRNCDVRTIIAALGLEAHITVKEARDGRTGTERGLKPPSGFKEANAVISQIRRGSVGAEDGAS